MTEDTSGGGRSERGSITEQRKRFLLAAAVKRDRLAEARDAAANRRDMQAALDALMTDGGDKQAFEQRTAARQDRDAAREDRRAAARDRETLPRQHPRAT